MRRRSYAVMRFLGGAHRSSCVHARYGMYGIVGMSRADEIAAGPRFARPLACRHHDLAAAREYLAAAEALRLSPRRLGDDVHVRVARAVLLAAAARDPALAKELRREAASLPRPMGCGRVMRTNASR